jgi:hypothetical protein
MIIVNPSLEESTQSAPELGGDNPNILWIKLDIGSAYFVASIYLPETPKTKRQTKW